MAAPRKYTNEQRAAMFALWEQGIEAVEIARRCKAGLASVAPFEIPRRTVHSICTAIGRERAAPSSLDEAAVAVEQGRFLERVLALLDDEVTRLEAKQGTLTASDLERAGKIASIGAALERRLRRRATGRRAASQGEHRSGATSRSESVIERLVREEKEREAKDQGHDPPQRTPRTAEGRNGATVGSDTRDDQASAPEDVETGFTHARTRPAR